MTLLKATLLLTSFALFGTVTLAQNYYPPVVNYSTQDYGKNRNPENLCVVQDQRGVMYFGNSHGVLEYDGKNWNFIVVNEGAFVSSLAVDSSGVVYVGSNGDFGYLKPNDEGRLKFNSLLDKINEDDKWFSRIWKIVSTRDKVYFQAYESFFVYDIKQDSVTTVYPQDFFSTFHTSFLIDTTYYLRERDFGLVKYENGQLKTLAGTDTVKGYGVFGLHQLDDDSLFIITQELGFWKWANDTMVRQKEQNRIESTEFGIIGATELSDGNYALYTATNGVIIINQKGVVNKRINRSKGMRSNEVRYVFEDRDQNIWLALGNGISKVNYHSPLSYFNEKSGIEGNVDAIIRFKERLFIGTSFGLFIQDMTSTKDKEFKNTGILKNNVWDFCIVEGTLYIASSDGIFKTYDGEVFKQINHINTNTLIYLKDEKKFVGSGSHGIHIYNTIFGVDWSKEMSLTTSLSIVVDPNYLNTLWIGTVGDGVFRIKWGGGDYILDNYTVMDGLDDNQLAKPILFENRVVFGSPVGLLKFIDEDEMVLGLDDSLKSDPLYYRGMFQTNPLYDSSFSAQLLLLVEDFDKTWFCADEKIGIYDFESETYINKPFWGINYGRVNEFYKEEDGVLWIGCSDGLVRYEENNQKQYKSTFYSLIRKIIVTGDSTVFSGAFMNSDEHLVIGQNPDEMVKLSFDYNDVFFAFAAPYFEDEHIPEFSFILEGHDEKWSEWVTKTEANFTNLHEGSYSFKVKARNIYGHISEIAEYDFEILPPWYRTTFAYVLYVFGFVLIFLIGLKISSARLKKKNIWLEGIVEERTREISDKNVVLEQQKKEISDSINYAKRIQEAILPLESEMKKWIPDSFVLFRPKDVVSGDFYWFMEKDNKLVFVCADCTGHGVPGAFMSMIGSDRLNNIVSEYQITDPGKILSELNRAIKKSLKQDGQKDSTRDGMDAAVCTIDLTKNTIKYSGAFRPLWMLKNGGLTEVKATKVAVAGFTPDDQVFEEHEFSLDGETKYYLTSDGYADQFGGPRGKKYKVKQMKEFIIRNSHRPFLDQKDELVNELENWMGDQEQIDDVCVIGFKA